jgi:hypothetical protein
VEPEVELQVEMAVPDIYIYHHITAQEGEEVPCPLVVSVEVVLVAMVVIPLTGPLQVGTEMVEEAPPQAAAPAQAQGAL